MIKWSMAVLLLVCSGAALADEVSHRRLAEELMGLTQTEATVRNWRKRFDGQAQEVVADITQGRDPSRLTEEQMRAVQHFNERGGAVLDDALSWSRLQEPLIRLYMQTFTEADTRELVAFYKTPVGQKMLTGLPALSEGLSTIVRNQVDGVRPRLQAISQDFRAEYAQAGGSPQTRPATPRPAAEPTDAAPRNVASADRKPEKKPEKKPARPEPKKPHYTSCKDPTRVFPHCSK